MYDNFIIVKFITKMRKAHNKITKTLKLKIKTKYQNENKFRILITNNINP